MKINLIIRIPVHGKRNSGSNLYWESSSKLKMADKEEIFNESKMNGDSGKLRNKLILRLLPGIDESKYQRSALRVV
jgi:hypothetical protein